MGDQVERALEETVPLLRQVRKHKLLSEPEVASIVRRRRDHEYALRRPGATRSDFMCYAAFEGETAELLSARAEAKELPEKRARSITAQQAARVNLVYSRAIRKFKGDDALYLHYARHCIATGSRKAAEKVLARAIAHRSDSEKVWLAAAAFHFDACGDVKVARAISQRGLRALKNSKRLWLEYFRLELVYVAKLVARRTTVGVAVREGEVAGAAEAALDGGDSDARCDAPSPDAGAKLGFWEGGVPLAVFRSAIAATNADALDAVRYLEVAAAMPFAPPALLERLAAELKGRFGDAASPCALAIILRNPFDAACARLAQRRADVAAREIVGKDAVVGPKDAVVGATVADAGEGVAELLKTAAELATAFVGNMERHTGFAPAGEAERGSVVDTVSDFMRAAEEHLGSALCDALRPRWEALLQAVQAPCGGGDDGGAGAEHSLSTIQSAKDWSAYLSTTGAAAFGAEDASLLASIRAELQKVAAVPFRSAEQERICSAWLGWERDVDALREACGHLFRMPPSSLALCEAAISAELRLASADTQPVVPRVRALFRRAASLPDAKENVDFWLNYFKFERDTARDAALAANTLWSAKRTLLRSQQATFDEKCILMNLT
jgi:hypothetical protein